MAGSAEISADFDPADLADSVLDVAVIGAGLIGLATAMALLKRRPGLRLAVLEKEQSLASHQSGHNSGVIHAGLYYKPGSLKARFCRAGRQALMTFADEHGIPYQLSGKLVVASDEGELGRLRDLAERGRANGLASKELTPAEFAEIEPNVRGVRALHVPESGVVDYRRVAAAYAEVIAGHGGAVLCGRGVRKITARAGGSTLATDRGPVIARTVVTCAGLQSDRVAAMTGHATGDYRIIPFRGDYYTFLPHAANLVRGLVYPVPDPGFPFLGVHFTRGIDGSLHAGPNAVPAFAREGYGRLSVNRHDLLEVLRFPGFRHLARSYAGTGAREIWRDLVKPAFLAEMRRYLPMIRSGDVTFGPSGVRAQCLSRSGLLVDDFLIEESAGAVHVLNAPSPAATASLVIGQHCAARAIDRFGL
ncbi:MAG TPA: L-2-hydroxyglutarate oxidase [Streptosporangiaceae bacterium]|nr:L-2-hydroxyglutarate oxidase [Streptosporangiaceae bacterium]